jgi:hypothetical protein
MNVFPANRDTHAFYSAVGCVFGSANTV